jgi:hypothetical protein
MLKPLTYAAILAAASTPALASGPTPADVATFSAALAGMPSLDEIRREQASGDIRGFTAAMRRAMDVTTAVAERDYPQLGAGWKACQSHMITRDGGLTHQFEPSFQNRMHSDPRSVAPHGPVGFRRAVPSVGSCRPRCDQ